MKVYFGDGNGEIDADGESSDAGKEPDQHEQAAKEFGEGREVGGPAGQSEAGDELYVVVKSAEDFLISVADHDGAQGETHDEQCQRLQTIEVAQVVSSGRRNHRLQQRTGGGKWSEVCSLHSAAEVLEIFLDFSESVAERCLDRAIELFAPSSELLVTFFRLKIRVAGGV